MEKTPDVSVGEDQIAVYSPNGDYLYAMPTDDARQLLKAREATRITEFAIRLKHIPDNIPMPVPYVFRQMLPNDSEATCWAYALKHIPDSCRDLFGIAVRECMAA